MSVVTPDIEQARIALASARRMRSQWIVALNEGQATWQQLLETATRERGEPLRKIALIDILQALMTTQQANARMRMLRARFGVHHAVRDRALDIAWLLQTTARPGHRLAVFCDLVANTHAQRAQRVHGYPYAAPSALKNVWN